MLPINFKPFPVLESERLFFRAVSNEDASIVFQLRSNSETMKYIPRPLLKTIDDALEHIKMIQDKIE